MLTANHQDQEIGCVRRAFQDYDELQSTQCTIQYHD